MSIKNQVMLITYPDSMGNDLKDLAGIIRTHFQDAIKGVHILPFFPSAADRGFAVSTYETVDESFGTWAEMRDLSKDFHLMYDFTINHISSESKYFKDFIENKDNSKYADFFIRYKDFWPNGEPTQEHIDAIYKRKPRAPYIEVNFKDGTNEKIWCTFNEEQLDLNVEKQAVKDFIKETLIYLAEKGASFVRLDAFAYATKKIGTSCFFIEPNVWELLDFCRHALEPYNVEILPEIHEHYTIQLKLAEKGYWCYDFSLPMLLLHALYEGTNQRLIHWLRICPRKQFTTLDTHDGLGVVDVKDLLSDAEIERTRKYIYSRGKNVNKAYSTMAYQNLDIFQINCTFYSALGNNDDAYLLCRAIQFYTPGIPQVYYVGLLAGENDIELVETTRVGRNVNRHYFTRQEIDKDMKRPIMKKLINLMRFRNNYEAFNGEITIHDTNDEKKLEISWKKDKYETKLSADLATHKLEITYFDDKESKVLELKGL